MAEHLESYLLNFYRADNPMARFLLGSGSGFQGAQEKGRSMRQWSKLLPEIWAGILIQEWTLKL